MTKITVDDVQHLAQLSSLLLEDSEINGLRRDLEAILEYVDQLSELDTEGVEPTYQVTDLENVWRDDKVAESGVSREDLVELADSHQDGQIKVPKVLSW